MRSLGTGVDAIQFNQPVFPTATGPGASQGDPLLPNEPSLPSGLFNFINAFMGAWIDPPFAVGYEYEALSPSLFTAILDFPAGFANTMAVSADGTAIPGSFGPGDSVVFDGPATRITITGISPLVDAQLPDVFPIRLAFDTPTASLTMRPILPATTPLAGTRLLIANAVPDDESKNKLDFLANDETIDLPSPGSPDDPRCTPSGRGAGATIAVTSPTSGQSFGQTLPCFNWSLIGTEASPKGYRYADKDLDDGPCRKITLRSDRLAKAVCRGNGPTDLNFDLQGGQAQSPVGVVLTVGSSGGFCAEFGQAIEDGSDGRKLLAKNAPPPPVCP